MYMAQKSALNRGTVLPYYRILDLVGKQKDTLKINFREEQYFNTMKSYNGIIEVGQPEDNLEIKSNEEIIEKYPEAASYLNQVFSECGHTHHKILIKREPFQMQDNTFLRFFREERIFFCMGFPEDQFIHTEKDYKVIDSIFGEIISKKDKDTGIRLPKGLRESMIRCFDPTLPNLKKNQSLLSKSSNKLKINYRELTFSLSDKWFDGPSFNSPFHSSKKNGWRPNLNKKTMGQAPGEITKNQRLYAKAYDERWGEFKYHRKVILEEEISKIKLPLMFSVIFRSLFMAEKHLQEVKPFHPKSLQKHSNEMFNSLKNVRLAHNFQVKPNFQLEGPMANINKKGEIRRLVVKKGYQYIDYSLNIDSINIKIKEVSKKPRIFGDMIEISKFNLNFFYYTYNIYSDLVKDNIMGSKAFYCSEEIDWGFIENFKMDLIDKTCSFARGINSHLYKQNSFCLNFTFYSKTKIVYPEDVYEQFIELVNTQLEPLRSQNTPPLLLDASILAICSHDLVDSDSHDTLLVEVKSKNTEDSLCMGLYWLSATSYCVRKAKQILVNASRKLKLGVNQVNFQLENIPKLFHFEPCIELKIPKNKHYEEVKELLCNNGFKYIDIGCSNKLKALDMVLLNPDYNSWAYIKPNSIKVIELMSTYDSYRNQSCQYQFMDELKAFLIDE